jgi:Acetyltransferases, including N-acetylases of ribosomal proteins
MIVRSGKRVRLRTIGLEDVELVDAWSASPQIEGEFNDFGVPHRSIRTAAVEGRLVGEAGGTLLVERADGTPIGVVSWHGAMYGPNPESRAWNIGISLIPEARGHGLGVEAQRLLAERLFSQTSANRVEASTDVENYAERRALEKAGFQCDGVQRGAQWRNGAWHDIATYALIRGDL